MLRKRNVNLFFLALGTAILACTIPPEILDAINRLPTPAPTATPAPSEILYVDKLGNDENDCLSAGTACLTIKAALQKAADGAAIYIGPGSYDDDDGSGGWILAIHNRNVSLYGAATPGGLTTILGGGGPQYSVSVAGIGRVVLENLAIIDSGSAGLHVAGGGSLHVTLRNVELRNHAWAAVKIMDTTAADAPIVVLENVRIIDNPGGAIDNEGNLTLRNSRVINNRGIPAGLGWGAGTIYNDGTLHLIDSTVAENDIGGTHVIHNTSGGTMTIERSTISGNGIDRHSALYNNMDSAMTLINSTVSGNSGSAITSLGDLTLSYTTIAGNGLSGLYANSGPADPMHFRLENSIIENNGEQDCSFQPGHSIVFDMRGRNLSDGSCLFEYGGIFTRPPEGDFFLADLADNGGPTQTRAVLEGSLAIDHAEGLCPAVDQRGVSRPIGGACDVGAYEFAFASTAVTPAETPIPIWTPTPTEALPLMVTLIENANCRKGPATGYDLVTSLTKGDQVLATGRNDPPTWWQVQVPVTGKLCWISGTLLEVPFDPALVPVVSVPPLPNAPGSFHVSGSTCSANLNDFSVELSWVDPGGETGFRLYRNGELIATLGADTTSYTDNAPKGTALTYEIEAFNTLGRSTRTKLSVPACA